MILKVIGVILLVILGLILAAVLLILFVPVRYRADVSFEGKPDGEAAVSWLLHLVRIRVSYHEHADISGRVLWFKLFDVRLWPSEDEEEQKTKSETEPVFAEFEKTPVLSENDSEIRNTEVSVLTENEQQEIPLETVAETSKAEEKKTAGDDGTAVPAEDDELVVHATELISESNESSSPSVLPAGALKNSSKENFKEPVVKEERVEEVKNCFGAKIKEKLARLIKQARTLWDRLRELPGKIRKLADGISKKKISLERPGTASRCSGTTGRTRKRSILSGSAQKNLSATFFRKRCRDGFTSVSMIPTIRGRFLRWSVRFMAYTREH